MAKCFFGVLFLVAMVYYVQADLSLDPVENAETASAGETRSKRDMHYVRNTCSSNYDCQTPCREELAKLGKAMSSCNCLQYDGAMRCLCYSYS